MKHDRLETRQQQAAQEYHEPPSPPRERMWARIDAARADQRRLVRPPVWHTGRFWWPMAAAAALAIGFLSGRFTAGPDPEQANQVLTENSEQGELTAPTDLVELPVAEAENHLVGSDGPDGPINDGSSAEKPPAESPRHQLDPQIYRYAAAPVFSRAELLLTRFRAGEESPSNGDGFSHQASGLLAETRLLLDSPAADDRQFRRLLIDLELVLAQIGQLTTTRPTEDREWIADGLQQRSLLPRLRAQMPDGTTMAHISGGTK
ncbi:MAG: hypothetical protein ABIF77_15460 [bacterium]